MCCAPHKDCDAEYRGVEKDSNSGEAYRAGQSSACHVLFYIDPDCRGSWEWLHSDRYYASEQLRTSDIISERMLRRGNRRQ
jgi:hypothetical protein